MNDLVIEKTTNEWQGYVYAIQCDRGLIKIGKSISPIARINSIATISGVSIQRKYISEPCVNYSEIETAAHKRFDGSRLVGEWFSAFFEDVCSFIQNHKKQQLTEREINEKLAKCENNVNAAIKIATTPWGSDTKSVHPIAESIAITLRVLLLIEEIHNDTVATDNRPDGFIDTALDKIKKLKLMTHGELSGFAKAKTGFTGMTSPSEYSALISGYINEVVDAGAKKFNALGDDEFDAIVQPLLKSIYGEEFVLNVKCTQ